MNQPDVNEIDYCNQIYFPISPIAKIVEGIESTNDQTTDRGETNQLVMALQELDTALTTPATEQPSMVLLLEEIDSSNATSSRSLMKDVNDKENSTKTVLGGVDPANFMGRFLDTEEKRHLIMKGTFQPKAIHMPNRKFPETTFGHH